MDTSSGRPPRSEGHVVALSLGATRGEAKSAVDETRLVAGLGLEGDAHAGTWHRQVSLLDEAALEAAATGAGAAELGINILSAGLALEALEVGRRFRAGERAVLQVTQRGLSAEELGRCRGARRAAGDPACPWAARIIFARVRRGGALRRGESLCLDPELDRVRCGVLTLSDRGAAGLQADASGERIVEMLARALEVHLVRRAVLPDERETIARELVRLCDEEVCDLVVTTGGTGLSPRDVTPEATRAVIDREVPGMAEAMRAAGLVHTPRAMLSRGVCGLRGSTLIVNLSGSPKAVSEQLEVLLPALPHAIEVASGLPQSCAR